jgi:tetratricopeptide (TPR) repeat protein
VEGEDSGPEGEARQSTLSQPIAISGRILTREGTPPSESAAIELICGGKSEVVGQADAKGGFTVSLGAQVEITASRQSASYGIGGSTDRSERQLNGCEIRASLPGYRSSAVQLTGRKFNDSPNIGVIILTYLGRVEARTASLTSLSAPKSARTALEKGLGLIKKRRYEEAKRSFEIALQRYPQYAEAQYNVGIANLGLKRREEAVAALEQSTIADPKFIKPQLALLDLSLSSNSWRQILAASEKVLSLDAYSYAHAWYFNALAHLHLGDFEAAQRSALQTLRLDDAKRFPKTLHILGLAQAGLNDWHAAAKSLHAYISLEPGARDINTVRSQLGEIEGRLTVRP